MKKIALTSLLCLMATNAISAEVWNLSASNTAALVATDTSGKGESWYLCNAEPQVEKRDIKAEPGKRMPADCPNQGGQQWVRICVYDSSTGGAGKWSNCVSPTSQYNYEKGELTPLSASLKSATTLMPTVDYDAEKRAADNVQECIYFVNDYKYEQFCPNNSEIYGATMNGAKYVVSKAQGQQFCVSNAKVFQTPEHAAAMWGEYVRGLNKIFNESMCGTAAPVATSAPANTLTPPSTMPADNTSVSLANAAAATPAPTKKAGTALTQNECMDWVKTFKTNNPCGTLKTVSLSDGEYEIDMSTIAIAFCGKFNGQLDSAHIASALTSYIASTPVKSNLKKMDANACAAAGSAPAAPAQPTAKTEDKNKIQTKERCETYLRTMSAESVMSTTCHSNGTAFTTAEIGQNPRQIPLTLTTGGKTVGYLYNDELVSKICTDEIDVAVIDMPNHIVKFLTGREVAQCPKPITLQPLSLNANQMMLMEMGFSTAAIASLASKPLAEKKLAFDGILPAFVLNDMNDAQANALINDPNFATALQTQNPAGLEATLASVFSPDIAKRAIAESPFTLAMAGAQTPSTPTVAPVAEQPKLKFNTIDTAALSERSRWTSADGSFNTARLASDGIAGAVLGTAGGLITHTLVKSSQSESGFANVQCKIADQTLGNWGDSFVFTPNY